MKCVQGINGGNTVHNAQPCRRYAAKLQRAVIFILTLLVHAGLPFHTLSAAEATSEYRLQAGDAIRLTLIGFRDFNFVATIRGDGEMTIPLIGNVSAAGLTFTELRTHIVEGLTEKVVRLRTGDQQLPTIIEADEIHVTMESYRPVFVDGDVRSPGEQPFAPGLTVRQALARAGGGNGRMFDPVITSADLSADRAQLISQVRMLQAAKARIRAELSSNNEIEKKGGEGDQWLDLEQNYLTTEAARVEGEWKSLSEAAKHIEDRIAFLTQEVETRQRASELDAKNESELLQRLERGLTDRGRVTDAQRANLDSAARLRQAMGDLADARRQLVDVERTRDRLGDERSTTLLRELIRIEGEIAAAESRLTASTFKLAYTGVSASGGIENNRSSYTLKLIRSTSDGPREIEVTLDTELQPGDFLQYNIKIGRFEEASRPGNSG